MNAATNRLYRDYDRSLRFLLEITFLNTRSAPSSVSSASISRAVSMNRLDCSGSSGLRLSLSDMMGRHVRRFSKICNHRARNSSRVSLRGFGAISGMVGQSLALAALDRNRGALLIVNAELGAVFCLKSNSLKYRSRCLVPTF